MYRVIRFYQRGGRRVVKSGLTLEEARRHCRRDETHSMNPIALKKGRSWFDGYEEVRA